MHGLQDSRFDGPAETLPRGRLVGHASVPFSAKQQAIVHSNSLAPRRPSTFSLTDPLNLQPLVTNRPSAALQSSGIVLDPELPLCQTDLPLDWYQREFKPYAEEYLALPDRRPESR